MGTTSDARTSLFGDIRPFVRLLAARADALSRAYPDPDLRPIFASLPHRSIAVAPMALCSALAQDLGTTPPPLLLEGLGVLCLHISTHDDIVDQRPASRRAVGALLFGGNIATLTGIQLIREATDAGTARVILEQVARNHAAQQLGLRRLWDAVPKTFAAYRTGITHDAHFAAIGIVAALAVAARLDLRPRLWKFCLGYGTAFQLLDDITEAEEDKVAGYHSFPLREGPPYDESFRQVFSHLDRAARALAPKWARLRQLIHLVRAYAGECANVRTPRRA